MGNRGFFLGCCLLLLASYALAAAPTEKPSVVSRDKISAADCPYGPLNWKGELKRVLELVPDFEDIRDKSSWRGGWPVGILYVEHCSPQGDNCRGYEQPLFRLPLLPAEGYPPGEFDVRVEVELFSTICEARQSIENAMSSVGATPTREFSGSGYTFEFLELGNPSEDNPLVFYERRAGFLYTTYVVSVSVQWYGNEGDFPRVDVEAIEHAARMITTRLRKSMQGG